MFIKLLLHDFLDDIKKRLSALIVAAVSLVVSIVLSPDAASSLGENPYAPSLLSATALAASVAGILMIVSVVTRFHRSMLTPELHLTLARPASRAKILLSKTLAGGIWLFAVTTMTAATTTVFFSAAASVPELESFVLESELYASVLTSPGVFVPLMIVYSFASALMEISAAQFAVTFGALIPRSAKVIIGIAMYFGVVYTASSVSGIFDSMLGMSIGTLENGTIIIPKDMLTAYHTSSIILSTVISLGVAIGLFFVTKLIYNKKLSRVLG